MLNSTDLYLGSFLILCGFALSLINLKKLIKKYNPTLSSILISENILLVCIGVAFISRSVNHMNPTTIRMYGIEERTANSTRDEDSMECNFQSVLLSYGPLIISLVNSFLTLVIDNYMHYKLLADGKEKDDENTVREISSDFTTDTRSKVNRLSSFLKKYITFFIIAFQWTVPILLTLGMYTVDIKESVSNNIRNLNEDCVNILDMTKDNCSLSNTYTEYTLEFRNYVPSNNYLIVNENDPPTGNTSKQIDSVIKNVYKILANLKNDSIRNVNTPYLYRKPKSNDKCMKVCYLENKQLLLYIFVLAVASFFIPVTISTIILTKIHIMNVKKNQSKIHVKRELLYNILFWSPVMFDTFLSMLLCSYSMNGIRTSIFNIIANVYQAVKNIMNIKYFSENSVTPV